MVPSRLRGKIVADRLEWIRRMVAGIRSLPLDSLDEFTADLRTPAAADSYLRRGLEALLDLGRHILAKGFGRAAVEYKTIAWELEKVGVLGPQEARLLAQMAGYRNRLVYLYHEISVEELYETCVQGLEDVERIAQALERWLRTHPEKVDESW